MHSLSVEDLHKRAMIISATVFTLTCIFATASQSGYNPLVKMCISSYRSSGHARSDPIINQNCASGHVHSFYGPQNFHPNTSYEDIRDTPAQFSSTPFIENQSLYWHPTIYKVIDNNDGTKTYSRSEFESTPYYRWDNSVLPRTEAYPPGFRMIAHSNDDGAQQGELDGVNLLTECCFTGEEEVQCDSWNSLHFPTSSCDYLEILFSMPTCWDGISLGDDNDHKSHMSYTTNGKVNGPCPKGFDHRVPQITLTVFSAEGYHGGTYQLSDGADVFHVDFFNGWEEGKLQDIIDNCEPTGSADDGYNPPCACTTGDDFLTSNEAAAGAVCEADVRRLIIDEATDVLSELPPGSCEGPDLIPKSWTELSDELFEFDCSSSSSSSGDVSSSSSGDSGSTPTQSDLHCFSSHTTVNVLQKGKVKMNEVEVGDQVLTSTGNYEIIYTIDHRHPKKLANFVQIFHIASEDPLELTEKHMLFVKGNPNPIPAKNIKVGDQVQTLNGASTVTMVLRVARKGVFNPLTVDGTIVASGIISSTYSAFFSDDDEWIKVAGKKIMTHHDFFNMALKPYKSMCTTISLNMCTTNNEMIAICMFGATAAKFWLRQGVCFQNILLSLSIILIYMINIIISPYFLPMLTGLWIIKKRKGG